MDGGIEESDSSVVVFFARSLIKSSLNKWPLLSGSSNYAGGIATGTQYNHDTSSSKKQ